MDRFDPKQPNEAYYLGFDFSACFTDDNGVAYDAISSVNDISVINDADDTDDQTANMVDQAKTQISGNLVKVWFQAGTSGNTYQITVRVTGDALSETFELDALLPVAEV